MRHLALSLCLFAGGCECGDPPGSDGGTDRDAGTEDGAIPDRDGGGPPDSRLREGPVCTPGGWCWETPLPAGLHVSGIWSPARGHVIGAGSSNLFHVDPSGTIRHAFPPTPAPYLNFIPMWGPSPDDLWSMGFGSAIHFDGTEWTQSGGVGFANAMSGTSSDDVWAVGFSLVHHYDGSAWTMLTGFDDTYGFTDVWAIGPGEAIIVGQRAATGVALHVRADGTFDDLALAGTSATSVYASSADDVWVAQAARVQRRQGGTWSDVAGATGGTDMWGSGPDDVWMTNGRNVLQWNGSEIVTHTIDGPRSLLMMAGTASDDVWVSDYDGALHHYDGTMWSSIKRPIAYDDLIAGAATDDEAWAIGQVTLARRNADAVWELSEPPVMFPGSQLTGIARAGDELFLFANNATFRRSAESWGAVTSPNGLRDACALDDGTIWAVGNGFARFEGGAFVADTAIDASPDRVFCVGDEAWAFEPAEIGRDGYGALFSLRGGQWARINLTSIAASAVTSASSSGPDDAWVVAGDPDDTFNPGVFVMRFDGAGWREVAIGGTSLPLAVDSSASGAFIVGEMGLARRWDGTALSAIDAAGAPDFTWVHDNGDGTARAVSRDGAVWDYGASGWSETSPAIVCCTFSSRALYDVAFSGGDIYAAGDSYEALRWRAGTWEVLPGFFSARQVEADGTNIWYYNDSYELARWNGTMLETTMLSIGSRTGRMVLVGSELYFWQSGALQRLEGTSLVAEHMVEGDITGFFGSPNNLWLLDDVTSGIDERFEIWHNEGTAWSLVPELTGAIGFGTDTDGALVVVDSNLQVHRRESGAFVPVGMGLGGITSYTVGAHVYSSTDIWAVALNGVLHFDGSSWTTLAEPLGIGFNDLVASPNGTLYAVGRGASVARRAP